MNSGNQLLKEKNETLLSLAEQVIHQTHYDLMESMETRPMSDEESGIDPGNVLCLFRVPELVYSREDDLHQRLTTILNALYTCGASCLMLLQCREGRSELYLGAINKQKYENIYYRDTIRDVLRTGIEGNLPGTELEEVVRRADIDEKIRECLDGGFDGQCITSVSCMGGERKSGGKGFSQGLENLLGAVGQKNFTLMILADPVTRDQVEGVRLGYEQLDSQLSAMDSISLSYQKGSSYSDTESTSRSIGESLGHSISLTQSHSESTGWSKGGSQSKPSAANKAGGLLAVGAGVGLTAATAATGGMSGFFAMNAVTSLTQLFFPQSSMNNSQTGGTQDGTSRGTSDTDTTSVTFQDGKSVTVTSNTGNSLQMNLRDRHVQDLCQKLDWYLKWLDRCENQGMFNCSAYVISANASINMLVASQYQAMVQGDAEVGLPASLNTWTRENGVEEVRDYLMHLMHPALRQKNVENSFTPAMMISSGELSCQLALPRKSVVGISVMEYASFGQEVVRKSPIASGDVARIGVISHMGKQRPQQPVFLDVQSLAAHTFVAGTNGSGKSNMIFRLLEELMRHEVPFMVIEPAKGEYKNIFGRDHVRVYGTNRRKSAILRLNPFWFNEDVDVREHIDKLIEVFNASWPMYAAMPAVLKAAIENAYRECGWDLSRSVCRGGYRIFPTVKDLLGEFGKKMAGTAFSAEVRGNYEGALSTRLESLCNGIYKDIFGGANLSDEELFDQNVIVDLSRVGSSETKAMIMGMLLIRLQEYRMKHEAMNLPPQHVTVLEEAHNLLRRTSAAQSEDGSNLLGKSVEMISNSIAEMRSYGEGFIIADQSPGLLDMSVMRNTNTKIILRLPEAGDREMVGNTMGLTDKQIYEISRLKTGVCAIYQKDWLEAVLCQIDRAAHAEQTYQYKPEPDEEQRRCVQIVRRLLEPEAAAVFGDGLSEPDSTFKSGGGLSDPELISMILDAGLNGVQKRKIIFALKEKRAGWDLRCEIIHELLPLFMELPSLRTAEDAGRWKSELIEYLREDYPLEDPYAELAFQAKLQALAKESPAWENAAEWFRKDTDEETALKEARGAAFALLCPLSGIPGEAPEDKIPEYRKTLSRSGWCDQILEQELDAYQKGKEPRQPGDPLEPYASVIWNLLGGEKLWNEVYPYMRVMDYAAWDMRMRPALEKKITCGRDTQTSVMSLFLQYKAKTDGVRKFFTPWLNQAKKKQDERDGK
ncbi:MAG: DUF87 domain-containing protein [Lachnospiraceae bacterium]|nr:DUF87 domain-containing protein [Lachnospiraceae bacterium]